VSQTALPLISRTFTLSHGSAIDVRKLYPLIEELREKTGRRLVLAPSSTLPVRAQITSGRYEKRVLVAYRVEKGKTGDLAHEILRAIQMGSAEWDKVAPIPVDKQDGGAAAAARWIQELVNDAWIEERMRAMGIRTRIHNDIMDANLETLERDARPFPSIEDPKLRLIYSMAQYASFLLTRDAASYGRKGERLERHYRELDPQAMSLGIRAAEIVRQHGCLTPVTAGKASQAIIELSGMSKRIRIQEVP